MGRFQHGFRIWGVSLPRVLTGLTAPLEAKLLAVNLLSKLFTKYDLNQFCSQHHLYPLYSAFFSHFLRSLQHSFSSASKHPVIYIFSLEMSLSLFQNCTKASISLSLNQDQVYCPTLLSHISKKCGRKKITINLLEKTFYWNTKNDLEGAVLLITVKTL